MRIAAAKDKVLLSLDSNLLIRALQSDKMKSHSNDPRLQPSKGRAVLANLADNKAVEWALHAAQLEELFRVTEAVVKNGGIEDIKFDTEELQNACELLAYLRTLRTALKSGHSVKGLIYTREESPGGTAIYETAKALSAETKSWINIARDKMTDPTTDIIIYLNAFHQGRENEGARNYVLTEDADFEVIEKRVHDIYDVVRGQSSAKYQDLQSLHFKFYSNFCYHSDDKRKTVALLPKVQLYTLRNMQLEAVTGIGTATAKILKQITPDIS